MPPEANFVPDSAVSKLCNGLTDLRVGQHCEVLI